MPVDCAVTLIEIVQFQLEAYNRRDLETFLSVFSETIRVFRMPALEPSISGKVQLAEFYATQRFNRSDLRADLINRIAFGNKVIDHERIHGVLEEAFEIAAVYEIVDGLIQTMWAYSAE
jgi:hypothetical protein